MTERMERRLLDLKARQQAGEGSVTEPSRSTVQCRPSGMGTFQSSRWRPMCRAVVPKCAAMALAVRSRPMPAVSISIPKVWFFMGFAPFAWPLRFPAGLFARPARRDTFITLRRRKSNPTEATRIRAQNSSDLTRAAPEKKRFLIRQKRAFLPARRLYRRGGLKPYTSRVGCSRFARAAARLTPAQTVRAVPAALRCSPNGGSNPWAVPAGDRGPLSCEFSQNSGVGVWPQKSKSAALFRTAVCIENGEGQAHACHFDHIIPHRGDMRLFWDESNWQALCESWHDHKIGYGL